MRHHPFPLFVTAFKCRESALDKIRICVEHLSRKTPLQRFLQRQEISESIKEGHRCLDGCLERFHVCFSTSCRVLVHGSNFFLSSYKRYLHSLSFLLNMKRRGRRTKLNWGRPWNNSWIMMLIFWTPLNCGVIRLWRLSAVYAM